MFDTIDGSIVETGDDIGLDEKPLTIRAKLDGKNTIGDLN